MRQQNILECLIHDKKTLEEYGIKTLSLFGSAARDERKETSDIDILVTFKQPLGLFAFLKLKDHLEDVLDAHVDLVTQEALHPHLRKRILKESIHVI